MLVAEQKNRQGPGATRLRSLRGATGVGTGWGAGSVEESERANAQAKVGLATLREAEAELVAARAKYDSRIDGVNASVAEAQAKLDQALYYLDNTTIVAPEDGRIMNLPGPAGMVAGIVLLPAPSPPSSAMTIATCWQPFPGKPQVREGRAGSRGSTGPLPGQPDIQGQGPGYLARQWRGQFSSAQMDVYMRRPRKYHGDSSR